MSIFSVLFGSSSQQNSAIKVLSSEDFKAQSENKKVQLIDVRTPKEYKSGHIKGAKNIDFFSGTFNRFLILIGLNINPLFSNLLFMIFFCSDMIL